MKTIAGFEIAKFEVKMAVHYSHLVETPLWKDITLFWVNNVVLSILERSNQLNWALERVNMLKLHKYLSDYSTVNLFSYRQTFVVNASSSESTFMFYRGIEAHIVLLEFTRNFESPLQFELIGCQGKLF